MHQVLLLVMCRPTVLLSLALLQSTAGACIPRSTNLARDLWRHDHTKLHVLILKLLLLTAYRLIVVGLLLIGGWARSWGYLQVRSILLLGARHFTWRNASVVWGWRLWSYSIGRVPLRITLKHHSRAYSLFLYDLLLGKLLNVVCDIPSDTVLSLVNCTSAIVLAGHH